MNKLIITLGLFVVSCAQQNYIHQKKLKTSIKNFEKLMEYVEDDYQKDLIPEFVASYYYIVLDVTITQLKKKEEKVIKLKKTK